jgi:tetratricopeptide (TPR) repeat protein
MEGTMVLHTDVRGLTLSTANAAAATCYDGAIKSYFEYRLNAGARVKSALEADPDFALAHCLKGYLLMLFGTCAVHDKARAALADAESRAGSVTAREAAHIAALRLWLTGDMARTCALWEEILIEHPRDLLALRLQHFAYFWMGCSQELRGAPARVLHAWDESVPGYGNVLGMLAFGYEECGDYVAAERLGRRAFDLDGEDLWALHAVAHVLEMQGRLREGIDWLDRPADAWDDRNPFRGHLWWHLALFHFERGAYDNVLALYDRSIRADKSDFYLDIQNCASLLARLEFQGVAVGDRWDELADHVETRLDDHVLAFTDAHAMLALTGAKRPTAEVLLVSLRKFGQWPGDTAAAVMAPVAIPVCQAIRAYGRGDFGQAVELLLPRRDGLIRLGASHAQRDIFVQLLLQAAIRDGQTKLARALLSERALQRPTSFGTWITYAAVLDTLGETAAATHARHQADAARAA